MVLPIKRVGDAGWLPVPHPSTSGIPVHVLFAKKKQSLHQSTVLKKASSKCKGMRLRFLL